jgi:hypothetical protein
VSMRAVYRVPTVPGGTAHEVTERGDDRPILRMRTRDSTPPR